MKKYFTLLLFLVPFLLCAETEMRMRNLENRVKNLEESSGNNEHYDPITPNAGPKVLDGMDMFLTVDFIYWTARQDGLSYAKSGIGDFNTDPVKGSVHTVDWSWEPGFKAGYGWTLDHGGWDLFLQYTWFYTNNSDTTTSSNLQPGFQVVPPFALNLASTALTSASASWNLHYQTGDLELGRNYYINRYLKLRPFFGLKGTWQKQQFNSFFQMLPIEGSFSDITSHQKQNLWGIGMRTGLNTSWQFYKWFGLYGDFALSGMWLNYKVNRKDFLVNLPQHDQVITTYLDSHLHQVKPVLEFALGLRFETYFNSNRLYARFQAGWESQIWINQTFFISTAEYYNRFDLNLHGLTATLRFDF